MSEQLRMRMLVDFREAEKEEEEFLEEGTGEGCRLAQVIGGTRACYVGRVRAACLLCAGLVGQKRRCLKHVRDLSPTMPISMPRTREGSFTE